MGDGLRCRWVSRRSAKQSVNDAQNYWCPGEDSNLHHCYDWYLKPARLPIPPPGPRASFYGGRLRLSIGRRGAPARRPALRSGPRRRPDEADHACRRPRPTRPAQSGRRTSRALRSSVIGQGAVRAGRTRRPAGRIVQRHVVEHRADAGRLGAPQQFGPRRRRRHQHVVDVGVGAADLRHHRPAQQPVVLERREAAMIALPGAMPRRQDLVGAARAAPAGRPRRARSAGRTSRSRPRYICRPGPARNLVRLVPFSRRIWARSTKRASLMSSAPPSPEITFLVSWKLSAPRWPMPPSGRPS